MPEGLSNGVPEKRLAGNAGEQRLAEREQLVEVGEERVVFVVDLAEAETRIEDDAIAGDAGGEGAIESGSETGLDEGHDFGGSEARLRAPFVRASAGVHEDDGAAQIGAGLRHGGVPRKSRDVVDDFCAGSDGGAGRCGVIRIHGEHRLRALAEDGGEDGEDAVLLLLGGDGLGAGTRGFTAEVEEVGAFIEHGERVGEGGFRSEVRPRLGE